MYEQGWLEGTARSSAQVQVAARIEGRDEVLHGRLIAENTWEDFTVMSALDPDWQWTDPAGHVHRVELRDPADRGSVHLPTVEEVPVSTYWCEEHHEEHTRYETRCRRCGSRVHPGTKPYTGRVLISRSTVLETDDLPWLESDALADRRLDLLEFDEPVASYAIIGHSHEDITSSALGETLHLSSVIYLRPLEAEA